MTSVRQTTVVTSSSSMNHPNYVMDGASPLDGSLDALLEDLQNSVSRPGSSLGMTNSHVNGPTSGATNNTASRVVQREVRVHRSGGSAPSVQYLQPANSTTVVAERASSPLLSPIGLPEQQQRTTTSYKTYHYQYHADGYTGPQQQTVSGVLVDGKTPRSRSISPTPQKIIYSEAEPPPSKDNRLRQNLNELDSLLVDLHHAQQSTPNVDPNSQTAQQITRTVRTYQFDNTYGTPNSVRRELYPPSPKPERSTRAKSPPSQPSTYTASTVRAPSPTRKVTTTVKTYTYEIPADNPAIQPIVSSPTIKTYSYELPPDKASPPPEDTIVTYKYTSIPRNQPLMEPQTPPETTTIVKTYKYPSHPVEREPLIECPAPKQPHPAMNNTYITYNYSSSTVNKEAPSSPPHNNMSPQPLFQNHREPPHRPFPSPVPTPPVSAEPPKRLDELMASFTDTDAIDLTQERMPAERHVPPAPLDDYPDTVTHTPAPARPTPVHDRVRTKNIAGPPVYYPPGVELFSRKDEPVHAKMKEGASPPDNSGKGSGAGVAAVPVCLPLCCAMPCVIM